MTYAITWRNQSEVFMAADTALTSSVRREDFQIIESSFGQDHVYDAEEELAIEERVVKLFLKHNIGIVFAGSYSLAIKVSAAFYQQIEKKEPVRQALEWALFENPFPPGKTLQLTIAYYDNGPQIVSYNANHDNEIREDLNVVQIGNPLQVHRDLTATWIQDLTTRNIPAPQARLAAFLGVLQSYNLFSPQMERGIGGAFCGLFVDTDGGHWQPDILFLEYGGSRDKNVSTCVRHDCLVINSPTIGQSRCLSSFLPPLTQNFMYLQSQKAMNKGKKLTRNCEYEYIVFLVVNTVSLTLISMQRNNHHAGVWLDSFKDERGAGVKIAIFPGLKKILLTEGLKILDYVSPTIKKIPPEKIISTEIDYN